MARPINSIDNQMFEEKKVSTITRIWRRNYDLIGPVFFMAFWVVLSAVLLLSTLSHDYGAHHLA